MYVREVFINLAGAAPHTRTSVSARTRSANGTAIEFLFHCQTLNIYYAEN